MIDKSILPYLRDAHGLYNFFIFLLFLYQGSLGFKIRKERMQSTPAMVGVIRRHRQYGPVLSVLGVTGFISGLLVNLLDTGMFLTFRLHFIAGLAISLFITITYLSSRGIKGRDSAWRSFHLAAGIILVCFYFIQIFIGIGMLF